MGNLISMSACPHCNSGHRSSCYAEYVDGYKCFSCGVSKSYNSHRMAVMGRIRPTIKPGLVIPRASLKVSEWPVSVLKWLYSYYVFDDIIKKYKISYIEESNSLLYHVVENNEIVFAQTRGFPNKRIRGIGAKQLYKVDNGHNTVVIVEDYISCIRLAENDVDTICLFGTSIKDEDIRPILSRWDNIIVWLDGDVAGINGRKTVEKKLKRQRKENKVKYPLKFVNKQSIIYITSRKDPKTYSDYEIKEKLNE